MFGYRAADAAKKSDIADLEFKIAALDRKIDALRAEKSLCARDAMVTRLGAALDNAKTEVIRWMVGVAFAQVATIYVALQLFPSLRP